MSIPPKRINKGNKSQFRNPLFYREITKGPRKGMLVRKTRSEIWKDRVERERLEELEKEIEARAAWEATKEERETRLNRANSINTKLWAWGVDSEKHPTKSLGIFPTIIMYLVVIPILAVLYKLSFTILAPLLILGVGLLIFVFNKIKRHF